MQVKIVSPSKNLKELQDLTDDLAVKMAVGFLIAEPMIVERFSLADMFIIPAKKMIKVTYYQTTHDVRSHQARSIWNGKSFDIEWNRNKENQHAIQ